MYKCIKITMQNILKNTDTEQKILDSITWSEDTYFPKTVVVGIYPHLHHHHQQQQQHQQQQKPRTNNAYFSGNFENGLNRMFILYMALYNIRQSLVNLITHIYRTYRVER